MLRTTQRTTKTTKQEPSTARDRYFAMPADERKHVCGDFGAAVNGSPLVCTLHKGHAGSHYDGVAAMAWTGDRCPECLGVGERLARLDAGALTVGQYRACLRCSGKGRIARAA